RRQELEHRLDRRLSELRIRRMRRLAAKAQRDALRALRAAGELALRRLTVDEELAGWRQTIRGSRAVGPRFLADDEEQIDAILPCFREPVGRGEHRRGDSLGVGRAASIQPAFLLARRDIWKHRVEVRRERD